jgi:circadian clock protein KaiB
MPKPIPNEIAVFRLYMAGEAPNSMLALHNLNTLCYNLYGDNYRIELIDVLLSPETAWAAKVTVTPTLIRIFPLPIIQIVGNLSETNKVLNALGLSTHD